MIWEAELVVSSPITAAWHRPLYHSGSFTPPKWRTKKVGYTCSGIARDDVGSGIARDDVGNGDSTGSWGMPLPELPTLGKS